MELKSIHREKNSAQIDLDPNSPRGIENMLWPPELLQQAKTYGSRKTRRCHGTEEDGRLGGAGVSAE